jgi:Transposase DDE domain
MASMAGAVAFLKDQSSLLDADTIHGIFAMHGHRWRERELSPAQTIELFIRQVVAGNVPCQEVRCFAEGRFTASAYCQARARLPVQAVWNLAREVTTQLADIEGADRETRWHGHRTFHVDGTGFSMPDTPPLQEAFGQPGMQAPGCGFPVAHLLSMFDSATGLLMAVYPAPLRTHDLADIRHIHRHLSPGDILIGDRAFGSWTHLALLQAQKMHGVFPLHQHRKSDGGQCVDRTEHWSRPKTCPHWMDAAEYAALPREIPVRVIRRRVRRGVGRRPITVTLCTTLLDAQAYPADEIVALAASRWDAETNLRHLKITLNLDVLRCKSVEGVLRELAVIVLVYNLVRQVMLRAAQEQGVPMHRVSFIDALRWIRWTGTDQQLYAVAVNPYRPDRIEPRVVKRRHDKYDRMTRPRAILRKELQKQRENA